VGVAVVDPLGAGQPPKSRFAVTEPRLGTGPVFAARVRDAFSAVFACPSYATATLVRSPTPSVVKITAPRANGNGAEHSLPASVADAVQGLFAASLLTSGESRAVRAILAFVSKSTPALSGVFAVPVLGMAA